MISISTLTSNTAGNVIIHELPDSQLTDQSARVSRVKTLDGGVVITHSGVSVGDRTLSIRCHLSESDAAKLTDLFEQETLLRLAFDTGVYLGVIATMNIKKTVDVTLFLKEKVA